MLCRRILSAIGNTAEAAPSAALFRTDGQAVITSLVEKSVEPKKKTNANAQTGIDSLSIFAMVPRFLFRSFSLRKEKEHTLFPFPKGEKKTTSSDTLCRHSKHSDKRRARCLHSGSAAAAPVPLS